jgi:hypothetical protein
MKMADAPERIVCRSGIYYDYSQDWYEGEWVTKEDNETYDFGQEAEYVRADLAPSWQPIETAPKGKPRKEGAKGVCWMLLAIPDDEGGFHIETGMRCGDDFYACLTFYIGGPWDGKQYKAREVKVHPTHWMPLPAPPAD